MLNSKGHLKDSVDDMRRIQNGNMAVKEASCAKVSSKQTTGVKKLCRDSEEITVANFNNSQNIGFNFDSVCYKESHLWKNRPVMAFNEVIDDSDIINESEVRYCEPSPREYTIEPEMLHTPEKTSTRINNAFVSNPLESCLPNQLVASPESIHTQSTKSITWNNKSDSNDIFLYDLQEKGMQIRDESLVDLVNFTKSSPDTSCNMDDIDLSDNHQSSREAFQCGIFRQGLSSIREQTNESHTATYDMTRFTRPANTPVELTSFSSSRNMFYKKSTEKGLDKENNQKCINRVPLASTIKPRSTLSPTFSNAQSIKFNCKIKKNSSRKPFQSLISQRRSSRENLNQLDSKIIEAQKQLNSVGRNHTNLRKKSTFVRTKRESSLVKIFQKQTSKPASKCQSRIKKMPGHGTFTLYQNSANPLKLTRKSKVKGDLDKSCRVMSNTGRLLLNNGNKPVTKSQALWMLTNEKAPNMAIKNTGKYFRILKKEPKGIEEAREFSQISIKIIN
ncbi:unnamed protein product [Moneuplotes crassus]|uniref:Uncharacterized protein n=1 Tax=Euplotes crassus TaxID=5936 RepID=A0AAD1UB72_EUPCR|nr:unnamed protein product [Moneuplotes crassus]